MTKNRRVIDVNFEGSRFVDNESVTVKNAIRGLIAMNTMRRSGRVSTRSADGVLHAAHGVASLRTLLNREAWSQARGTNDYAFLTIVILI